MQRTLRVGRLGTGDLFSREADRIDWFGNFCEEMETAAICRARMAPAPGRAGAAAGWFLTKRCSARTIIKGIDHSQI